MELNDAITAYLDSLVSEGHTVAAYRRDLALLTTTWAWTLPEPDHGEFARAGDGDVGRAVPGVCLKADGSAQKPSSTNRARLVPKPSSRGAKWISDGPQSTLANTGHETTVTLTVEEGTHDWLRSETTDFMDVAGDAALPGGVWKESNEPSAFGVGVDLLEAFNSRVKKVSVEMKGSGKQVLLEIVRRLSLQRLKPGQLVDATKQIRAGMLLHGSTGDEAFEHMGHLRWGSVEDKWGRKQQGIASKSGVLLSQFVDALLGAPGLEGHVLARLPQLSRDEYQALEHSLWVLVSAVQMFEELNSIEVDEADLDVDKWVEELTSKYEHYFRNQGRKPPE